MTPQELKNSILQLAIQGKLVEQRPEEGTAAELYKQIQAKKQALIKAGKIKKEKPLPEIAEDEVPFEIPESWMWVRLRDICTKIVDGDHNPPAGISEITPYWMLSAQNINKDQLSNLDQVRYLTEEVFIQENERTKVQPGDIFFTIVATLGRSCVYEGGYNICFQRSVSVLSTLTYNYYLKYALDSGYIQQFMVANATGTAQKGFYLNQVEKLLIALPPLAEQKRIVAKIEELLPLIERYEKAWSRLEDFNKRFPGDMQKSILQMAIQGKLVEQRPEEGTGEELYKQIQAEKQALIKAGKIKKEKPLPEIAEDEIPFEIPDGWKWVYVGSIFNVGTGMTPLKTDSRFYLDGTIPWINSALTSQRYIEKVETYVTEYALQNTSLTIYPAHTIIVAMYGQGKTRGQTSELRIPATINQACAALDNIIFFQEMVEYVYYYFQYNYDVLRKKAEGTSQPNLNLQKIKETIIPLPPIAEQRRIVARLEELLRLCERLK